MATERAYDVVPLELRERPQWVVWRLEDVGKPKLAKMPYRHDAPSFAKRYRASSTNSKTWATFEAALAGVERLNATGIGYVFSADDPYVGVDLDDGLSEADRGAIIVALDSYAETSVSGTGVHVIVRADLNGHDRRKDGPFEAYASGRFFTVTGAHVRGTPATIEDRQEQLDRVLSVFLPPRPAPAPAKPVVPVDIDDQELLERAFRFKNGGDLQALYRGDWQGRYPSQSEGDVSLCSSLAFLTGRDGERIDRLFRTSGLMRPKWDERRGESTYGAMTIEKAIEGCSETYTERTRGQKSVESEAKKTGSLTEQRSNGLTDSALKESVGPESVPSRERQGAATDSDPESVADPEPLFSLPIRDFVARKRERREPLLASADGRAAVGRKSLTLCGALGGHGKTTFVVDLLLHAAAGVDFAPFTIPHPVSSLIIENEGPEELFAEKLEARLATFAHELKARLDVCVVDWGGFSLADEALKTRLAWQIREKGYDLVFGDPLDSLGIEGVGSPEDTRRFLELMKETGLNKTVAWWLNTHPRKEETKDALNEISGAWGGKPDSVFLLRMLDGDRTQVRQPKLRWAKRGKGPTLLFAFNADTEAFSYIGEQSEDERDYLAEIKRLLADGKWRIPKEIAAPAGKGGIGANVDTIKAVLVEHPDVFESRTGEAAARLDRSALATVWMLLAEEEDAP